MEMEVAVVSTSEVQDCITTCEHANGGSCGLYFRTVLLHVYMQMEVAVVSTSEVQGLYYCMCTCKYIQSSGRYMLWLWSLLQKFRDCFTACIHANGGSCGLYF